MAVLVLLALFGSGALVTRFGVDSRRGFDGRPDWRNRCA
jgi:hypothetical protein